jgi:hypothetical protein
VDCESELDLLLCGRGWVGVLLLPSVILLLKVRWWLYVDGLINISAVLLLLMSG